MSVVIANPCRIVNTRCQDRGYWRNIEMILSVHIAEYISGSL